MNSQIKQTRIQFEVGTRFCINHRLYKNQTFTVAKVIDDPELVGGRIHTCISTLKQKNRTLESDNWSFPAVSLEFYAERGLLVIEDAMAFVITNAESQIEFVPDGSQINYDIADGVILETGE